MCWNAAQATTHARVRGAHSGLSAAALQVLREHGPAAAAHWPLAGLPMLVPVPAVPVRGRTPAVGETVILLHLPLPLVGDSIGMWRERQQTVSPTATALSSIRQFQNCPSSSPFLHSQAWRCHSWSPSRENLMAARPRVRRQFTGPLLLAIGETVILLTLPLHAY